MTDFEGFLARQFAFSRATFGPGERHKGVIEHIRKELVEVEQSHGESSEWVDVCLLALDGLMRRLNSTQNAGGHITGVPSLQVAGVAVRMLEGKLGRNELRSWPDWRQGSEDNAIEHDRSGE